METGPVRCRFCAEFTAIAGENSRQCDQCKVVQPRIQFDIHQWANGDEAFCTKCCQDANTELVKLLQSNVALPSITNLPDGTCVCVAHSQETCHICKMEYSFPNKLSREKKVKGLELTEAELPDRIDDSAKHINRKICILDGRPGCTRTGWILQCACLKVTYCSAACQKHHW
jgi:hypothetical protein